MKPDYILEITNLGGLIVVGLFLVAFIAFLMFALPMYWVWSAKKRGEAELAAARGEQRIQVADAQARLEAADLNKRAELIDAAAVAQSIEIIGNALDGKDGYLQWQWIRMMETNPGSTIYVPTEAGLPILEAGKRRG